MGASSSNAEIVDGNLVGDVVENGASLVDVPRHVGERIETFAETQEDRRCG